MVAWWIFLPDPEFLWSLKKRLYGAFLFLFNCLHCSFWGWLVVFAVAGWEVLSFYLNKLHKKNEQTTCFLYELSL